MPFSFQKLEIPDVVLVKPRIFPDNRGFFLETYKRSEFQANGITTEFIQDNWSHSTQNVIRGMHYQKAPKTQAKLVVAIKGEILDVAIDLRKGSPTYAKWVAAKLSDKDGQMLYIPGGFAHGFCVLSNEADILYKTSAEYAPELEHGIRWDDPSISVRWPVEKPIISRKDAELPLLKDAGVDFHFETRLS